MNPTAPQKRLLRETDERLRRLERLAAQGDPQAVDALRATREQQGWLPPEYETLRRQSESEYQAMSKAFQDSGHSRINLLKRFMREVGVRIRLALGIQIDQTTKTALFSTFLHGPDPLSLSFNRTVGLSMARHFANTARELGVPLQPYPTLEGLRELHRNLNAQSSPSTTFTRTHRRVFYDWVESEVLPRVRRLRAPVYE